MLRISRKNCLKFHLFDPPLVQPSTGCLLALRWSSRNSLARWRAGTRQCPDCRRARMWSRAATAQRRNAGRGETRSGLGTPAHAERRATFWSSCSPPDRPLARTGRRWPRECARQSGPRKRLATGSRPGTRKRWRRSPLLTSSITFSGCGQSAGS